MSKAITIQQNGVDVDMTVDKLQVNKASGSAYWVPEDDVKLDSLKVTANGTYNAATANKYGYGYVTVSVPGSSVTGKGSDGNEHTISVDGSGNIVDTKVPSEIRITTPPDTLQYTDGDDIDITGMVVKAYLASGELYTELEDGIVPNEQITLDPDKAAYNQSTDMGSGGSAVLDAEFDWLEYFAQPLYAFHRTRAYYDDENSTYERTGESDAYVVSMSVNNGFAGFVWMSTQQSDSVTFVTTITDKARGTTTVQEKTQALEYSTTTLVNGITVYYRYGGALGIGGEEILPPMQRVEANAQRIATIIFDGTMTPVQAGSQQSIAAEWPRTGDGLVLEASFSISVTPGMQNGQELDDNG